MTTTFLKNNKNLYPSKYMLLGVQSFDKYKQNKKYQHKVYELILLKQYFLFGRLMATFISKV